MRKIEKKTLKNKTLEKLILINNMSDFKFPYCILFIYKSNLEH